MLSLSLHEIPPNVEENRKHESGARDVELSISWGFDIFTDNIEPGKIFFYYSISIFRVHFWTPDVKLGFKNGV